MTISGSLSQIMLPEINNVFLWLGTSGHQNNISSMHLKSVPLFIKCNKEYKILSRHRLYHVDKTPQCCSDADRRRTQSSVTWAASVNSNTACLSSSYHFILCEEVNTLGFPPTELQCHVQRGRRKKNDSHKKELVEQHKSCTEYAPVTHSSAQLQSWQNGSNSKMFPTAE